MIRCTVVLLALLAACGRSLTPGEMQFAQAFHGPGLDTHKIRVTKNPLIGLYRTTSPVPPRTTCAEKILPPFAGKTFTGAPAATVLGNVIHINSDFYTTDYLPEYPDTAHIWRAMFMAHELVHIWQWQNRNLTGYHPLKAAYEHQANPDPYLFDLDKTPEFLAFGYEQQGAIAKEFVCCAALAPGAARTNRLHRMLSAYFPVANLTKTLPHTRMTLPWDAATLEGLCD